MNVNTVNVIEIVNGTPVSVRAFTDDNAGNVEAEALFKRCYYEHNNIDPNDVVASAEKNGSVVPPDKDFAMMMDMGYSDEWGYELFLVHSTSLNKLTEDNSDTED